MELIKFIFSNFWIFTGSFLLFAMILTTLSIPFQVLNNYIRYLNNKFNNRNNK